jgi:hypothetical protein
MSRSEKQIAKLVRLWILVREPRTRGIAGFFLRRAAVSVRNSRRRPLFAHIDKGSDASYLIGERLSLAWRRLVLACSSLRAVMDRPGLGSLRVQA